MSTNYRRYSACLIQSVTHIFHNLLNDNSITEVFETQSSSHDPKVSIEIHGTLTGEILFTIPEPTLKGLTKKMNPAAKAKSLKRHYHDVAGEVANMVTGTLANQLQYAEHNLVLSPPEFNDDPIQLKTLYENVNISFISQYGGFDIDLYYKEE